MKYFLSILTFTFLFISCEESTGEINESAEQEEVSYKSMEDTSFAQYISRNKISAITAKGFAYKFGEPDGDGSILYKVNYSKSGKVLDSLIYQDNKVIASLVNEYNNQDKLLLSMIKDSAGNIQQQVERTYDENNNVLTFQLKQLDNIVYSQKMTYENDRMTKIVEFDKDGNPRIVTNYEYNESGKLITNTESDENGLLLKKTSLVYDKDGNNSVQTVYNSKGAVAEKNFLKDYDSNGNARLIEKYDSNDSLIVTYQYTYNEKGEEIKSVIYDGVGQIIRQSMSSFDDKGNQIGYEIFEGGKGLVGKDLLTYNDKNQEIQLIVLDKNDKQIKRKVTIYNEKDLIKEVINYDKVDEPIFRITFDYKYY